MAKTDCPASGSTTCKVADAVRVPSSATVPVALPVITAASLTLVTAMVKSCALDRPPGSVAVMVSGRLDAASKSRATPGLSLRVVPWTSNRASERVKVKPPLLSGSVTEMTPIVAPAAFSATVAADRATAVGAWLDVVPARMKSAAVSVALATPLRVIAAPAPVLTTVSAPIWTVLARTCARLV